MRGWQRELREEDFSGRRVVRALSDSAWPAANEPFGAAVSCLAEMTSDSVSWLWGDQLARGKITLLTGASGVGKSFVALRMVAGVTRGERDSRAETRDEPAGVLLISPEVELSDVVRPRLQAAGADLSRVQALRGIRRSEPRADEDHCRAFQLDEDLRLLEQEIVRRKAAGVPLSLVVIDPFPVELFAYRYGTADLVRAMRDLAEIAASSHVAILVVAENSTRLGGSWGNLQQVLQATAQSVWTVVEGLQRPDSRVFFPYPPNYQGPRDDEPEAEPDRLLLPVKASLKPQSTGLSFRLDQGRVEWNPEPIEMTAARYFARQDDRARSSAMLLEQDWSELARATHWLQRRLTRGVTSLREIKRAAEDHDISFSTLRRAFCGLKGVARRIGNSRLWAWALPEQDTESGRLPEWLTVEEPDATPASEAAHSEAPIPPEPTKPARQESPPPAWEPDTIVPLPDGGWTWKRLLERSEQDSHDEANHLASAEVRIPDT